MIKQPLLELPTKLMQLTFAGAMYSVIHVGVYNIPSVPCILSNRCSG